MNESYKIKETNYKVEFMQFENLTVISSKNSKNALFYRKGNMYLVHELLENTNLCYY